MPRPVNPSDIPATYRCLGDAFARKLAKDLRMPDLTPERLERILCRHEAPPPELAAAIVYAFHPNVPPDDFLTGPLPSQKQNGTLRTMSATESAADLVAPRRGRPVVVQHPLIDALKKARVTIAEEAKAVKRSPASVRSFCYPAAHDSFRPVPRALAEHWRRTYGVPLSAWSRIED